ncbi:MAG: phosphotriesterase, partial [Chloroflexi bacterium]|nr:phosphotriesterase [Chloroflexota bacterium]
MAIVRTVLGDIKPEQMGITYPHEHIVLGYTGAREDLGARFNRQEVLNQIYGDLVQAVRAHGVKTIVDVTPPEVGRDVDIMSETARRLNVNVVCATGNYTQGSGFPFYWNIMDIEHFEERYTREITEGVGLNKVKCGVVKVAIGGPQLSPGEEKSFRAAARVSRKLGVSICVHTSGGWQRPDPRPGALMALDVMLQEGADPSRIQMGHLRHTRGNLDWLLEIARKGCFMALDTIGRDRAVFNPIRLAIIGALVALGYGNRILL